MKNVIQQFESDQIERQCHISLHFEISVPALYFTDEWIELNWTELKGETFRSYMEVLLGKGIFNADGEIWKKQRKTASFKFASKNLRDYSSFIFKV